MKNTALILAFCLSAAAPLLADGTNQLADEKSRVSYAIGMGVGYQWKQQDLDFDPDIYVRGIKDAMSGGATLITTNQALEAIAALRKELAAKDQQPYPEGKAKRSARDAGAQHRS